MKHRIVLYNPKAPFYTMPLALVAIGSRLDPRRFDVQIVDGRLEADAATAVVGAIDERTVCLGVTVLTGAPIRDALVVTRAVRAGRPRLPIVWGGWHPSLFPVDTLMEAGLDAVVAGQGEEPFAELVDRLAQGRGMEGVAGTVARAPGGDGVPTAVDGGAAPFVDLNRLPRHDYRLIPVERYFERKRQRQIDYISSQGCRFRCAFCADPAVYKRSWSGLDPARVGDELEWLARRYGITDVNFQDETFFTSDTRVAAIADELIRRSVGVSWSATLRADQGARLHDDVLARCRRSGLRRVMIGVEAGSQPMLDWMKKDITIGQAFDSAARCARHGIGVLFNLIVGFPHETPESVAATFDLAKRLRAMRPDFEVSVFYYRPYPGNPITDELERDGVALPKTLDAWAAFEDRPAAGAWLDPARRTLIDRFRFYQRIGWSQPTLLRRPVQALARWRCRTDRYGLPVEKAIVEWLRPGASS